MRAAWLVFGGRGAQGGCVPLPTPSGFCMFSSVVRLVSAVALQDVAGRIIR